MPKYGEVIYCALLKTVAILICRKQEVQAAFNSIQNLCRIERYSCGALVHTNEELHGMNAIADVQSSQDLRNIPIDQVGIKDLRFPIRIQSQSGEQSTVARLTMTVFLPANQKGTHMSRFVALMEEQQAAFSAAELQRLTEKMLARLDSDAGKISASFPFFRTKTAPVSGIRSLLDYDVSLSCEIRNGAAKSSLHVVVPVTSLCPCST